ncbi:MAG: DUF4294 domain-containing protein [Bacteroidia bacterium]|nr:DUF4294 domain-containing protein [Bacteroidia bacterium]
MNVQISNIYKLFSLSLLLIVFGGTLHAQTDYTKERSKTFYTYEVEGVTYMTGKLDTILITQDSPSQRDLKRGKRKLRKFSKLRRDVHKTYPYAHRVSQILLEIQAEMDQIESEKELKEYIKEKEKSLFGKYEKDIRKMTRNQGKILVKLVFRETGSSMFELIKSNKSGASAVFWQSVGLIFGINLKTAYDPETEEMIEYLVRDLERGGYNVVYRKYNFQLD